MTRSNMVKMTEVYASTAAHRVVFIFILPTTNCNKQYLFQ